MHSPRDFKGVALRGLRYERNPSYLNSIALGFQRGLFWAPDALLRTLGPTMLLVLGYVLTLIIGAVMLIVGVVIWVFIQIGIVALGFSGRLTPHSAARDRQSVVN